MSHRKSNKCVDCGTPIHPVSMRCQSCRSTFRWQQNRETLELPNPSGLCQCGCGEQTNLARKSSATHNQVKDQPVRFIKGHENRPCPDQYTPNPITGCWDWNWGKIQGYGTLNRKDKSRWAHIAFYEEVHGPLPKGMVVDHLCRNPGCVNPDHLEAVSNATNIRRGAVAKLTMEKAEEIRRLYATGQYAQVQLARKFGVSQPVISKVVLHQSWSDDETHAKPA